MVYLGRTKVVHFVGIGGIGMSGIAEVLLNIGIKVSGSDLRKSDATERLRSLGAEIHIGHEGNNVAGADAVVYSSAVDASNPELVAARKRRIPIIPRTEMLAEIMRLKFAVTVAGSHGKTSTTSLVSSVLDEAGLDPTVVVGGKLRAISSNVRLGGGRYLVAEADESDGQFVQLPSSIAVITNIDLEHLDFYPDLDAIKDGFVTYANRVPFYGSVIMCADDANVMAIADRIKRRKVTYSLGGAADIRGRVQDRSERGTTFSVTVGDQLLGETRVTAPGDHHVRNALAAVGVGLELEIPFDRIKQGIEGFDGVGRRFEIKGEVDGVMVVDDYAHHPSEIAATVTAALGNFDRPIHVLFQPHRYSRTQSVAGNFAGCFDGAATVFVSDIYPAGEKPIPGVDTGLIVRAVKDGGFENIRHCPSLSDMVTAAAEAARSGDMVITMGAGDIFKAGERLLEVLADRSSKRAG